MNSITPATVQEHERRGPLDDAIAAFITQLQTAGYAKESLRNKRTVVRTFADWLRRKHISGQAINESHVAAFLKRKPGTLPPRLKYKHAALSGFLKYLRGINLISAPAPRANSPGDDVLREYEEYLRHDRGLAPNSLLVYLPFIRDWLRDHIARVGGVTRDAFDAVTIQRFPRGPYAQSVTRVCPAARDGAALLFSVSLSAESPIHGPLASGADGLHVPARDYSGVSLA